MLYFCNWFRPCLVLATLALTATLALSEETLPPVEPASQRPYTETIPDSKVRFDMVPIPGGIFRMGSSASEKGRSGDEGPQHLVRIAPMWMGKTEVTWDEFDLYLNDRPIGRPDAGPAPMPAADAITRPSPPYHDETWGFGRHRYPVVGISHHAAMEYCRWLSRKTKKVYRLPTEAEWEYACRAGTTTAYYFGEDPKQLGNYAWFASNTDETTYPVGGKKPNAWGLYDMYGNAAEWCLDHYRKDHYSSFPSDRATPRPVLLPGADRFPHVVRGGSFADAADRCRSAARRGSDRSWNRRDPGRPQSIWWLADVDFVGFRVVRPVAEQDNLKTFRSKVTKESP
jgi:formylglycine-generating enzyme required for sulfatase activity